MRNLTRLFLGKDATARAVTTEARRLLASRPRRRSESRVTSSATSERPIKEHLCAEQSEVRVVPEKFRKMCEKLSETTETVTVEGGAGMGEAAALLRVEKGGTSRSPMASVLKPSDATFARLRLPALDVPEPLDSGVFVAAPTSPTSDADVEAASAAVEAAARQVTLVVYEWHNVEPGTLWWVFPSQQAALSAARAMRNAVKWAIVAGRRTAKVDVDHERENGHVLAEQPV